MTAMTAMRDFVWEWAWAFDAATAHVPVIFGFLWNPAHTSLRW